MSDRYALPAFTVRESDFRTYPSEAEALNAAADFSAEVQYLARSYGARVVFSAAFDHRDGGRFGAGGVFGDEEDVVQHILETYRTHPAAFYRAMLRVISKT